jgi:hypothetical protein
MREFVSLYLLLRSGGNTMWFSLQHAWHLYRNTR